MKHSTFSWFGDMMRQNPPQAIRTDRELQWYQERYQRQWNAFRRRHRRNRALLLQVMNLLDARCAQAEYEQELAFLLGVQFGRDVGSVDLLRPIY